MIRQQLPSVMVAHNDFGMGWGTRPVRVRELMEIGRLIRICRYWTGHQDLSLFEDPEPSEAEGFINQPWHEAHRQSAMGSNLLGKL